MKKNTIFFLIISKLSIDGFSQSLNSFEINYIQPIVYNTKNSVSDNFYAIENGNIQLKKIYGFGLNYNKLLYSNWNLKLRTGLDVIYQSFQMPYYVYFASTKTTTKIYDFKVQNTNVRVGILKTVPILRENVYFNIGLDMVARTMKSDAKREIDQNIVNSATSDTVLLGFNAFNSPSGGAVVMEFNTGVDVKLSRNLQLHFDCIIAPRYKLGFSYDVTAVQAYWYQGDFYKYVWSDSKISEEYIFKFLRFGFGVKYLF